jgi:hypothetical protein
LTAFEPPVGLRWRERSRFRFVVAPEGGYDLAETDGGTQLTFFNTLEGRGVGALAARLYLWAARKNVDGLAEALKGIIEARGGSRAPDPGAEA